MIVDNFCHFLTISNILETKIFGNTLNLLKVILTHLVLFISISPGHWGPYGNILDHKGPYEIIRANTNPYWTIQAHTGPSRRIQDLKGP